MSQSESYTDVVELCAILQCLGFTVKSLDSSDTNVSQDGAARTVVINCQSSGLHVVLESACLTCSCPVTNPQNSGFWQVSGIAGGKQLDKESGGTVLGSLPKGYRERLSKELREMVRCIKDHNESDNNMERPKEQQGLNKSASMVEIVTPEKKLMQLKTETPSRYRSLDTLTSTKGTPEPYLPAPGLLHKPTINISADDVNADKKSMCRRQSTYTLCSTPGSVRRRNKTSSPIQPPQNTLLERLIDAEKVAEDLRSKLACVIRDFMDEGRNDSSMSSLALDVSKISVLKGPETSKAQFSSSPNLAGLAVRKDLTVSRLKRFESASTSNLGPTKTIPKDGKISKLRRLSPSMFKSKKDSSSKLALDKSSKLNSLFKPKIVTPVRIPRLNKDESPNVSASKKKYSHIKSTIPRPTAKKE